MVAFFLEQAEVEPYPGWEFGREGKDFVRLNLACPRATVLPHRCASPRQPRLLRAPLRNGPHSLPGEPSRHGLPACFTAQPVRNADLPRQNIKKIRAAGARIKHVHFRHGDNACSHKGQPV